MHLAHPPFVVAIVGTLLASGASGQSPAGVLPEGAGAPPACADAAAAARVGTTVGLSVERQRYDAPEVLWADWQTYTGLVRRDFCTGTLVAELFHTDRFERSDAGVRLDGYSRLWRKAVGNLRVQRVTGAEVLPGLDVSLGVTQGLGNGWEVDASQRLMLYRGPDVEITSGSIAANMRNWYIRATAAAVGQSGEHVRSYAILARRFLPAVSGFVEVVGSAGEQVILLGAAEAHEIRPAGTLSLLMEAFVTRRTGIQAGLSIDGAEDIPTRSGFSVGLRQRL